MFRLLTCFVCCKHSQYRCGHIATVAGHKHLNWQVSSYFLAQALDIRCGVGSTPHWHIFHVPEHVYLQPKSVVLQRGLDMTLPYQDHHVSSATLPAELNFVHPPYPYFSTYTANVFLLAPNSSVSFIKSFPVYIPMAKSLLHYILQSTCILQRQLVVHYCKCVFLLGTLCVFTSCDRVHCTISTTYIHNSFQVLGIDWNALWPDYYSHCLYLVYCYICEIPCPLQYACFEMIVSHHSFVPQFYFHSHFMHSLCTSLYT